MEMGETMFFGEFFMFKVMKVTRNASQSKNGIKLNFLKGGFNKL